MEDDPRIIDPRQMTYRELLVLQRNALPQDDDERSVWPVVRYMVCNIIWCMKEGTAEELISLYMQEVNDPTVDDPREEQCLFDIICAVLRAKGEENLVKSLRASYELIR